MLFLALRILVLGIIVREIVLIGVSSRRCLILVALCPAGKTVFVGLEAGFCSGAVLFRPCSRLVAEVAR